MAYTKLDAGLTDSTIWQAPDATRLVWITMLAMADQNGYVGASMPGLAGRARVALDACVSAVATLEAPDEWSRTKEHEGRRIAPAEGGWILLNHAKYRAIQSADDRRERSRIAMAELRAQRKQAATKANGAHVLTKLTQAEAEAEADTAPKALQTAQPSVVPSVVASKQRPARKAPTALSITDPMRAWASKSAPNVDLDAETAKFKDHTFRNAITDWDGAWRNWMRRAADFKPNGGAKQQTTAERNAEGMRLLGIDPSSQGEIIDA